MYPLAQQLLRASAKGELHRVIQLINDGATVAVNKVSVQYFICVNLNMLK